MPIEIFPQITKVVNINSNVPYNTLQSEIVNLTGLFYPLNSNPSGYITNIGAGTQIQVTGSTILSTANISGLSGINIILSGNYILIEGQINNIDTGVLTGVFYPLNSNPLGYISGNYVSILNGKIGDVGLAGQGNVSVTTNGQTINISGSTGIYSTFVTTGQTGNFGNAVNTGVLTGVFYPLNSNPAGYVTSTAGGTAVAVNNFSFLTGVSFQGISGISILLSGTTAFINGGGITGGSIINTGILTGQFYPLNQNPSGYISIYNQSGSYFFNTPINSGVTQQFIVFPNNLGNNPYVMCSLANTGTNEGILAWPSGITSSGYWSQFSWATDSNNYILTTLASISTTGSLATIVVNYNVSGGPFYPLNSNPASYVTQFQTGNFVTNDSTGNFNSNTGSLTGIFYPLNSNPAGFITGIDLSNYITSSQTGQFVTTGQTGNFNIFNTGNLLSISGINILQSGQNLIIYPINADFNQQKLFNLGRNSVDWSNYLLYDKSSSNVSIDWSHRILSGSWIGQSGSFTSGLFINGNSVVTGGPYYLNSNPNGFITGFNSGLYTLNSNTGFFVTNNQTGTLTGQFYPLNNNLSGFINTGSIIANTGIIINSSGNQLTIGTYFNNQFISGLPNLNSNTDGIGMLMPLANTYYNAISGNVGPGTWMTFACATISNFDGRVVATAKLWSGQGAFFAGEDTELDTSTIITGYSMITLNGIINLTAPSTPIVLSCANTFANANIMSFPGDTFGIAGGATGVSTYINMIRLY